MVSYAVPAASLLPYLPLGVGGVPLELDESPHAAMRLPDGRKGAVLSVIAAEWNHVRMWGIKWPRQNHFCSVALRMYVRQGEQRGVVYLREVVGSRMAAWLMRRSYNQPTVQAPMWLEVKQATLLMGIEHRWEWPEGGLAAGSYVSKEMQTREQVLRVVGTKPPSRPGADTLDTWLTERSLVFGMDTGVQGKKAGGTLVGPRGIVYEIIHPSWSVYPTVERTVRLDFASMFGADFGYLTGMEPQHATLAVGSEVAMFPKRDNVIIRWGIKRAGKPR